MNKSSFTIIILVFIYLFLTISIAKSQVLYTDINPDYVLSCPQYDHTYYYNIDIDHDDILDFAFYINQWLEYLSPLSGYCTCDVIGVDVLDSNSKIGLVNPYYNNGPCNYVVIDSGIVINEQLFYWNSHASLEYYCIKYHLYCIQDQHKKFIAVKQIRNGISYYGWIRMGNNITFRDMAINLNPFDSIIAGQREGEKIDYTAPTSIIFPNPVQNSLTICYNMNDESSFELYNLFGEKIKVVTLESGLNSKKIDLVGLVNGLYIYSIRDTKGKKIKTGKLLIQK